MTMSNCGLRPMTGLCNFKIVTEFMKETTPLKDLPPKFSLNGLLDIQSTKITPSHTITLFPPI